VRDKGASSSKACFIASFRSWEHVHTHTHTRFDLQYKIYTRWCNPTYTCFPYTWVLRLASRLCTLVCFLGCNHVMNCPCNSSRRRKKKKKTRSRRKKFLFSFARHCCRARGHGSLCNIVAITIHCPRHLSQFCPMSMNFR
jgi:hypothetical protein